MLQSQIKIIPEIIKRKEATFYLEELMSSTIPLRKRVKLFELLMQESIDINLLNLSEEFIEEYQKTRKSSQILSIQKRNRI